MRDLTRGVIRENPVFVTLLGLCPSLAVTTHTANGIALGLTLLIVLVLTSLSVSLLRTVLPPAYRVPAHLAVIALFVTLADAVMTAYLPSLREALGIFVPLLAVNCIILGRAEAFARTVPPARAVLDALGTGAGFTLSLTLIALVREVLGRGTITVFAAGAFSGVVSVPGLADQPVAVLGTGVGAFLVVGYLKALFTWIGRLRRGATEERTSGAAGEAL